MKVFCFTVDDNIRFLKETAEQKLPSLFYHPYMAMLYRLHERFGLKVQLNLFYRMEGFTLSQMPVSYRREWEENTDWLKLSFHSDRENVRPYETSGYGEVYGDCQKVQREILRFAGEASLAQTATLHYCLATAEGLQALKDNGVKGLLGLYVDTVSYGVEESEADLLRTGEMVRKNGITFAPIDIVLNCFSQEQILRQLSAMQHRARLWVMIHEQYFYSDYPTYQPDFEEKLTATFSYLVEKGYQSSFFEELLSTEQ